MSEIEEGATPAQPTLHVENPVAARRNVELAPPVPVQTTKGDDAAAPSGKPAGTPFARDEKMNWATQPLYLFCPNVKSCICSLVCPWWNLLTGIYVKENEGFLIQHFGEITAVIKEPGCYFVNVVEREMTWKSLKEQVIDTPAPGIKCLDCKSNPILVGGACYYRVEGVQAAVLAVENLELFIIKNFETVLKSVCSRYPYEADEDNPCSLKSESAQIGEELKRELQERTNFCGVKILACKLTDMSYAPEIAQHMLQKQAAEARVKARELIVAGAVMITQDAINSLLDRGVKFTDEEKTRLLKNLLSMICGKER